MKVTEELRDTEDSEKIGVYWIVLIAFMVIHGHMYTFLASVSSVYLINTDIEFFLII